MVVCEFPSELACLGMGDENDWVEYLVDVLEQGSVGLIGEHGRESGITLELDLTGVEIIERRTSVVATFWPLVMILRLRVG